MFCSYVFWTQSGNIKLKFEANIIRLHYKYFEYMNRADLDFHF